MAGCENSQPFHKRGEAMSDYAVQMNNICKGFGGISVLKNVNFCLKKGEIHALVGGNGAGKSTLMKIMTGVYRCDSGEIYIDGKEEKIHDTEDSKKCGIGMIFQELSLIPTLTVEENIYLNHELKGKALLNKREMRKKAEELLEDLEIDVDVTRKIQDLEVGVCQLVEIAKALSVERKILIMDEPTASLTDEETQLLFRIMHRLQERGVSIVYISHRMKEVLEISDRISILRNGEIVKTAPAKEMTLDTIITHMMGESAVNSFLYQKRKVPVSTETMLKVEGLTWKGNPNKISFEVKKGEVVGLIGLLGSGRTETLETLFGLRKQYGANIVLDGEPLELKNPSYAIEKGITLIPEDRRRLGIILMHSVKENLNLPNLKTMRKGILLNNKKCKKEAEACVERYGVVTDGVDLPIQKLSGGNQQKIVIAKWFEMNPKLILMDEPTAGVDIGAKGEIVKMIRNFAEENKSVIFVSSELAEVMAVCDRVLVYRKGKITGEILREEMLNEEVLQNAIQN